MKINKKEYGMGGSTMEMYKSGGMLKALLKDPAQREMAKSMLQEFEEGGKVEKPEPSSEVGLEAVPTKQDLEEAYKNVMSEEQANISFEDFLKRGVDSGELERIKSAAVSLAEKRLMKEQSAAKNYNSFNKSKVQSGDAIAASYRPGSEGKGQESLIADRENVIMSTLQEMGLKL